MIAMQDDTARKEETSKKLDASELPLPKREGRDANGKWIKGKWKGGPGNPHGKYIERIRNKLLKATTPEDMDRIARQLVKDAQSPDFTIRHPSRIELLNRLLGKSAQPLLASGAGPDLAVNLAVVLADPRLLDQFNHLAQQLAHAAEDDKPTLPDLVEGQVLEPADDDNRTP